MRTISLASVADNGRVRLGAGIRQPGRAADRLPARPSPSAPRPAPVPAAVADTGNVRLGAGIRRG